MSGGKHYAVVLNKDDSDPLKLRLLEQNINKVLYPQSSEYNFAHMRAGTFRIYRPIPKGKDSAELVRMYGFNRGLF